MNQPVSKICIDHKLRFLYQKSQVENYKNKYRTHQANSQRAAKEA